MKSCYLDANLLVYFKNKNSLFHLQTKEIFKKLLLGNYQIFLSPLSLDEYEYTVLRSSNSPRSKTFIDLRKSFKKILKITNIKLINPPLEIKKHLKVLRLMAKYNLKPRDAYHLFIMLENKIKYFASFDRDFEKVFDKKIIKKFS